MQEEEPAFQDSMLPLDDTLEIPDESSDGQQAGDSMEYDLSSPFQAESMEYSPESQDDDFSDSSPHNSNCLSCVRRKGKQSRSRGSRGRGRERARGSRNRGRGSQSRGRRRARKSQVRGRRGTENRARNGDFGNKTDWVWSDAYIDDSSMSSPPCFSADCGPSSLALSCSTPEDFFRLVFTRAY